MEVQDQEVSSTRLRGVVAHTQTEVLGMLLTPKPNLVTQVSLRQRYLKEVAQTEAEAEGFHEAEAKTLANQTKIKESSGVAPPTELSYQVGGILERFADNWRLCGATFWQLQAVKRGVAWTFISQPPLSNHPIPFCNTNPEKNLIMKECIRTMLQKGAIEPVMNISTPGFYSLIFLKPKPNGEMRPIIDLSALNRHILTPTFTMESAQSV